MRGTQQRTRRQRALGALGIVYIHGRQEEEHPSGEKTLALLKVHSTQLRRCSKYFETCLSERWRSEAGTEFSEDELDPFQLILEANAGVTVYKDCFCRMYSPFRKDFRDVAYSLELLKVASQIEYRELMDCLSLYLSAVRWSDEDERRIRDYSSSPDFSRNHAQDLVIRLGLNAVGEDHMKKVTEHTWQLTIWGIINALWGCLNYRKFVEELLEGNLFCTMTKIIVLVAKKYLVELDNKCLESGRFTPVEDLGRHVSGVCWVLRVILSAGVGEELVQCLLSSKGIPVYLTNDEGFDDVGRAGGEMAEIVLQIYQQVVAGRLLLRTGERVALIDAWHDLLLAHLKREDFDEATRALFLTLPLEDQVELTEIQEDSYVDFIDARELAALAKKNYSAIEGNGWPVVEGKCISLNLMLWGCVFHLAAHLF